LPRDGAPPLLLLLLQITLSPADRCRRMWLSGQYDARNV